MNKKFIIIFGSVFLLLIIIVGGITYYQVKGKLAGEKDYFSAPFPKNKEYEIWCYDGEKWIDCVNQSLFIPNNLVSITVDLEKFNDIPYDPYFLCYYSDLSGIGKQCFSRPSSLFEGIRGISLTEETIPKNKKDFVLIKISIFPDDLFKEEEEIILMNLEGKTVFNQN